MKILKKILEIFFPSHCISCENIISKDALFCSACWQKLQFITEPKCKICSYPFEVEIKYSGAVCSRCLARKPYYDKSITIFRYNNVIRKAISDLKYHDQTFLAKKFTRILFEKARNEISDADLIIAVPLHLSRLRKRKYNQAILLAKNIAKLADNLKFFSDFLIRTKNTEPQVSLRSKQRAQNLKSAFAVKKKYENEVKGKKIILLDDVMTTGATLENCAKELKKKGAREVVVLTVAKTVFKS